MSGNLQDITKELIAVRQQAKHLLTSVYGFPALNTQAFYRGGANLGPFLDLAMPEQKKEELYSGIDAILGEPMGERNKELFALAAKWTRLNYRDKGIDWPYFTHIISMLYLYSRLGGDDKKTQARIISHDLVDAACLHLDNVYNLFMRPRLKDAGFAQEANDAILLAGLKPKYFTDRILVKKMKHDMDKTISLLVKAGSAAMLKRLGDTTLQTTAVIDKLDTLLDYEHLEEHSQGRINGTMRKAAHVLYLLDRYSLEDDFTNKISAIVSVQMQREGLSYDKEFKKIVNDLRRTELVSGVSIMDAINKYLRDFGYVFPVRKMNARQAQKFWTFFAHGYKTSVLP